MFHDSQKIFVDTSAFYALIDRSDRHHNDASDLWRVLLNDHVVFITSNYVVWETIGLLQNRICFDAASIWYRDILVIADICWVDADIHQKAYELWLNLGRKNLNLLDCVSFVTMYQHKIEKVFCFKDCFKNQGFEILCSWSADLG